MPLGECECDDRTPWPAAGLEVCLRARWVEEAKEIGNTCSARDCAGGGGCNVHIRRLVGSPQLQLMRRQSRSLHLARGPSERTDYTVCRPISHTAHAVYASRCLSERLATPSAWVRAHPRVNSSHQPGSPHALQMPPTVPLSTLHSAAVGGFRLCEQHVSGGPPTTLAAVGSLRHTAFGHYPALGTERSHNITRVSCDTDLSSEHAPCNRKTLPIRSTFCYLLR